MKKSFVTVLSSIIILSLLTAVLLSSCSLFGTKEENDKNRSQNCGKSFSLFYIVK